MEAISPRRCFCALFAERGYYLIIPTKYTHFSVLPGCCFSWLMYSMDFLLPESVVKHNTKTKVYPDGSTKTVVCNLPIFKEAGLECVSKPTNYGCSSHYNMDSLSRSDSIKRSKEKVFDIVKMNQFNLFVTLTLDPQKIADRYDPTLVSKKLSKWLNNCVERKGLNYVLLPEHHKDGAIHMHMLCSCEKFTLVDSGKKDKSGRTIYNVKDWKLGFSSAIYITGNIENTAKYVTKYITKDSDKIFGKFYYSGGKKLIRSVPVVLSDSDWNDFENCKTYSVSNSCLQFRYPVPDGGGCF